MKQGCLAGSVRACDSWGHEFSPTLGRKLKENTGGMKQRSIYTRVNGVQYDNDSISVPWEIDELAN